MPIGFSSTGGARSLVRISYLWNLAFAVTAFSSLPQPHLTRPRKSLGQYFLVDERILGRIVAAARLSPEDTVVEIGPGQGALTRRLIARAGQVMAIELDSELARQLPDRLREPPNLSVINADARTVDIADLGFQGWDYKLVANLPYYAASPIIRRFLESDSPPSTMVVMVQREVAESMTAVPGKMTLLSVGTQFYANAALVCHVPAVAFRPTPKVTSAVVRLERLDRPAVDVGSSAAFFDLVRAGFSAPRKQLRNSLSHGSGLSAELVSGVLEAAGVDGTRRAETLTLSEWKAVYQAARASQGACGIVGAVSC